MTQQQLTTDQAPKRPWWNWNSARQPGPDFQEPTVAALIAEGQSAAANAGWDSALAAFERALARDPANSIAWFHKGVSLGALHRWDEALTAYDRVLALDPACAPAWYNRGLILDDQGRTAQAVAAYDRALLIDPLAAEVWFSKGLALDGARQHEPAQGCFARATQFGHDAAAGLLTRTRAAALEASEAALAAPHVDSRDEAAAWHEHGRCLANLNRHAEAVSAFDKAITLDPTAVACCGKAQSLEALGRPEEAWRAYTHAFALDPACPLAWHAEARRQAGQGHWEAALAACDQALTADPALVAAWIEKAECLQYLDRQLEALGACDQALAADPAAAAAWFTKGSLLALAERVPDALRCLERAQNLGHPRAERLATRLRESPTPTMTRVVAQGVRDVKRPGAMPPRAPTRPWTTLPPRDLPEPDPWATPPDGADVGALAHLEDEVRRLRAENERLVAAVLTVLNFGYVPDSEPLRSSHTVWKQRWDQAMDTLASAVGVRGRLPS